jgi:hypothetical protein
LAGLDRLTTMRSDNWSSGGAARLPGIRNAIHVGVVQHSHLTNGWGGLRVTDGAAQPVQPLPGKPLLGPPICLTDTQIAAPLLDQNPFQAPTT